jgi:hypothetical protein
MQSSQRRPDSTASPHFKPLFNCELRRRVATHISSFIHSYEGDRDVSQINRDVPTSQRRSSIRNGLGQHVPLVVEKLAGKTKIVATRVPGSPSGKAAFHRIAEVHFPSMQALEACAASEGGKETLANAVSISSGGPPVFLIAEQEICEF